MAWSIAVVLVAGMIAVLTTPHASGQTVVQQGTGPAVPADQVEPGAAGGPGTSAASGPASSVAAGGASPASTPAGPAPTAAEAAATKAKATTATTKAPAAKVAAAPATAPANKLQPDAGSYPLSISGTSSVDGKRAAVPTSGSLVIQGSGGDQQHRTVGVPGGLVLSQRASAAGVDLVSFSLTAGSKALTFRPPSPVTFVRTNPGASWSWSVRSTDGTVGVNQTATVSGGGSVSVGGTAVPAVIVQRTFTVSGAVQGTVRLTSTVSTVDRLPLVQHQVIDVKATVLLLSTRVVSDTTATLTSTRPR